MKDLDLNFDILGRPSAATRGGALEQNEHKPENSSRAPANQPILMRYVH